MVHRKGTKYKALKGDRHENLHEDDGEPEGTCKEALAACRNKGRVYEDAEVCIPGRRLRCGKGRDADGSR